MHPVERIAAFEIMQMGERLAKRERRLMPVERPAKQHRQHIDGAPRRYEGGEKFFASPAMMRRQLVDARMQAEKRQIVRRQHQGV